MQSGATAPSELAERTNGQMYRECAAVCACQSGIAADLDWLAVADERFAEHLAHPSGRGHEPAGSHAGAAGGAACGDLVTVRIAVEGDRVRDAGFDAAGCGATIAAGSAVVA